MDQKESKYTVLNNSIQRLKIEITSLEDFVDMLKGRNKPTPTGEKQLPPTLPFQGVYDGACGEIMESQERITKVKQELQELLV